MDEQKINAKKYENDQKELGTPPKKVEKVVTGVVKPKKKGIVRKLSDIFISEDIGDVKSYIFWDIVIPSLKDAIEDTIHMMLRGDSGRRRSGSSKISYREYWNKPDRGNTSRHSTSARTSYSYDDVVLGSRGEAEEVLARMDELIDRYSIVSVADFYDLVGITGNFTDNKYGWTDIRSATVVRVRDGYMIKLPKAMPLD